MTPRPRSLVVVGNGMVGHRFVEAAVDRGLNSEWDVVVFGAEQHGAYDRVALSTYVETGRPADLSLARAGEYDHVRRHLSDPVVAIDRAARQVRAESGLSIGYDALVLATGSTPFVPAVIGRELGNCFVYRTIDDVDAIRRAAAAARTGVVVGGGLLGLEAANALKVLGLDVHVVELAPRLMPLQVDDGGGAVLRAEIESLGIVVHSATQLERIAGDRTVERVFFADGGSVGADVVVFSAGVRPADALAKACGLAAGERGGVAVDDACRTADDAIYAIGECACVGGKVYGLVGPGYAMAEVVADRLAGGSASFITPDTSTKLKLLGVDVASFGDALSTTPSSRALIYSDDVNGVYKRLVVSDDSKRLLGGVLVGDASAYSTLRALCASDVELTVDPEHLLMPTWQ